LITDVFKLRVSLTDWSFVPKHFHFTWAPARETFSVFVVVFGSWKSSPPRETKHSSPRTSPPLAEDSSIVKWWCRERHLKDRAKKSGAACFDPF
jgi:hypothetical protein